MPPKAKPNLPVQQRAEQALGHAILGGLKDLATDWKTWTGVGSGVAIVFIHMMGYAGPATVGRQQDDLHQVVVGVKHLNRSMTEVKIATESIVAALPPAQQRKAEALIAQGLGVLKTADQQEGAPNAYQP